MAVAATSDDLALSRCPWAVSDPLMLAYHDREWGVPLHNDHALFELLTLEGAQAGLSWRTVLHRREGYRAAFERFDPERVARYTAADVERLLADERIIRNRQKVESTIGNARALLAVGAEHGSFDAFVWSLAGGAPQRGTAAALNEVPSSTPVSEAMSRELRRRGFRFVGPTICYAFMQATGMVNDHLPECFRYTRA